MPKETLEMITLFLPKDELLTFEELTRISKIYAQLGVKKDKNYRRRASLTTQSL